MCRGSVERGIRPARFQVAQAGFGETVFFRVACEQFDVDFAIRQIFDSLAALLKGFADGDQMESQEVRSGCRFALEAKGERRAAAMRQNGGEQIQFLGVISAKPSSHRSGNSEVGMRSSDLNRERVRWRIEQAVSVLQFVFGEPVGVGVEQQSEVMEFVLEFAAFRKRGASARSLAGVN